MSESADLSNMEYAARRAVEHYPDRKEGWLLLGTVMLQQKNYPEALKALIHANKIDPYDLSIQYHLGAAHGESKNFIESEKFLRLAYIQAKQLSGEDRAAYLQGATIGLARALAYLDKYTEALELLIEAHQDGEFSPMFEDILQKISQGKTRIPTALVNVLKTTLQLPNAPFFTINRYLFTLTHTDALSAKEIYEEHLRLGKRYQPANNTETVRVFQNEKNLNRPLKVGFISSDYKSHPAAFYLRPIWRSMNKQKVEIYAYANQETEDEVTATLRFLAKKWTNIHKKNDDEVIHAIKSDRIDILFDLTGHSGDTRLSIFARRAAPIQVSWLGNPNTTGIENMDYQILGKNMGILESLQPYLSEKVVIVPSVLPRFEMNAPDVSVSPCIANGYITFGSFNRPNKLSDSTLNLWVKVLKTLKTARLCIGAIEKEDTQQAIRRELISRGISDTRLKFLPRADMKGYFAQHNQIDILLDAIPFNGRTVTLHALWMGVPTLTLSGQGVAQNLGAEVMRNAGLPEWIAETEKQFIDKAQSISSDLEKLIKLRASLRDRVKNSEYFRPEVVADSLERALHKMWEIWCQGRHPESFTLADAVVPPRPKRNSFTSAPATRYRSW